MTSTQRESLLQSIALTVIDYRQGEIPPPTPEHVNRWVQQFDGSDQLIILAEMDRILKAHYVSRQRMVDFTERLLL